jgi:hypothetical protein
MTLLSAYEDFVERSLGALKGNWARFNFVAGLRGESLEYEHWGMEQTHGPQAARKAMAEAHEELLERILETPLPLLEEEFDGVTAESLSKSKPEQLLPANASSASREHFRYVLTALTLLAESRSTHQAA